MIGNGLYRHVNRLANPINDAEDLSGVLRKLGFELVGGRAHTNQTADQMKQLIAQFGEELSGGGVGLFYYAGLGSLRHSLVSSVSLDCVIVLVKLRAT